MNFDELDIVVSFNDIQPTVKQEYAPRHLAGQPFGFVEQLLVLGSSIAAHLPTARRYAVHTQDLTGVARQRLRDKGWTVERGARAQGSRTTERLRDRLAAYRVGLNRNMLLLDCDTLFLRTPSLDLQGDLSIRIGYAGRAVFEHGTWFKLFELAGLGTTYLSKMTDRAFLRHFRYGRRSSMPFFNNGAILIRRDASTELADRMQALALRIEESGLVKADARLAHFIDQVCLSLAVHQMESWDLLPPGMNVLSSQVSLRNPFDRRRIVHYHYLKGANTDLVAKYFPQYFS